MNTIGQKVVCINASNPHGLEYAPGSEIVEGAIYTVREVGVTVRGMQGLRLNEVTLANRPGRVGFFCQKPFSDAFYRADRFEPAPMVAEDRTEAKS